MSEPDGVWAKAFFWASGLKDRLHAAIAPAGNATPNGVTVGVAGLAAPSAGHLVLGGAGEKIVAAKVKALGWKILARNWRPEQEDKRRFGPVAARSRGLELDLVALDAETLVFVEVRTRTTKLLTAKSAQQDVLDPVRLLNKSKRERFLRAARAWLLYKDMWHYPCRFDLFCVGCVRADSSARASGCVLPDSGFSIEHYSNVLEDCHAMDSRDAAWQPW